MSAQHIPRTALITLLLLAIALPALAAEPAVAAATTPPSLGYGELLLKLTLGVALVSATAWLALKYGLTRLLPAQPHAAQMAVIARMSVEPRRTLLVVRVAQRHLLLASAESGLSLLTELTPEDAAAFTAQTSLSHPKKTFSLDLPNDNKSPQIIQEI